MSIRRMCVIAGGYPSEYEVRNEFIENLVNQFVDDGIECIVISPQSKIIRKIKKLPVLQEIRYRKTPNGKKVKVVSPDAMSFSAKKFGRFNSAEWTYDSARRAVEKAFKELNDELKFDAIYAHFIFPSALIASYLSENYGIPAFFAYGENTTYTIDFLGSNRTRLLLKNIAGVISVSTENKRVLLEHKLAAEEDIEVFPNAINSSLFYKMDKKDARERLGISGDKFIVAFVGRFLDVKGPDRLSRAIDDITQYDVFSFFMGVGPLQPDCRNILFSGPVKHDEMAVYLSAADVFVLPTKAEGCCNAIIEAMACGLPIISSALPFNDDILDNSNSIQIDPCNIAQIKDAIVRMIEDPKLRSKLSVGALETASKLSIDMRSKRILEFMNKKVEEKFPF